MNFIKKYKVWILLLAAAVVLMAAVLRPGPAPADNPVPAGVEETAAPASETPEATETPAPVSPVIRPEAEKPEETPDQTQEPAETAETTEKAENVPAEETEMVSPTPEEEVPRQMPTCLLSVRCDSVFENLSDLKEGKIDSIPKDGIIYAEKAVAFSESESAFDLLRREMEKENIPLDYERNAIFDSVYIKGISGLYERDCGGLSGWTYEVNGAFQNKGCSKYILQNGDRVEFIYTCG